MTTERYVGERRALWHFLSELRPLVLDSLGNDALLGHRIDRALKAGDLESLRDARRMFHKLPDAVKRRLMRGIFDDSAKGSPERAEPLEKASALDADRSERSTVIQFSAFPAARDEEVALSVQLDDEVSQGKPPIRVKIESGTLPRSAAETLRQIANWIEHDRRLLSTQHWITGDKPNSVSDGTLD